MASLARYASKLNNGENPRGAINQVHSSETALTIVTAGLQQSTRLRAPCSRALDDENFQSGREGRPFRVMVFRDARRGEAGGRGG